MKNILPHLEKSMQEIYRKAVDGDEKITALKKQGMAKFSNIFPQDSLFSTTGNAFLPYVSELADDIEQFKLDTSNENQLALILKKMEQLLKVLGSLKNIVNSN